MKMNQIRDNLSWVALRYQFGTVQSLQEAIDNGRILEMLKESADELHDGDLQAVLGHFRRNLSSVASNLKKTTALRTEQMHDKERYDMLWEYTGTLVTKKTGKAKSTIASIGSKARWQLSMEELEALPDDYKILDSVYQNMQSKMSKAPEAMLKEMTMVEYQERFAYISRRRSKAKAAAKRAATREQQEAVKTMLAEKLSEEDRAKLFTLLGIEK